MAAHCNFNRQYNQILFEGDSFYRKVILNRPDKLNCLNYEMVAQLLKNLRDIEMDSMIKFVILKIREGRIQSLRQCLIREYTIICNILRSIVSRDLYEGSKAMLIDKDKKPKWEPSKLELVSLDMVDCCFSGIDDDDWKYLQLPVRSAFKDDAVYKSKL